MIVLEIRAYPTKPSFFFKKPTFLAMASYQQGKFKLKAYVGDQDFSKTQSENPWSIAVRYLTSVVSQQRMWTACQEATRMPYLSALAKGSAVYSNPDLAIAIPEDDTPAEHLNASQQRAINGYLTSSNPINLIQGPPGTGKTTTIVALLERLMVEEGRVLVTAPSNKAVQVLAERFIPRNQDSASLLVGVEEKIPEHLKPFSLYSIQKNLSSGKNFLLEQQIGLRDRYRDFANRLAEQTKKQQQKTRQKELQHIKRIAKIIGETTNLMQRWKLGEITDEYKNESSRLCQVLSKLNWHKDCESIQENLSYLQGFLNYFAMHLKASIPEEKEIPKILLAKSKYVFSTLCSTGQLEMRNLGKVEHMIVDEAGQATEAETLIALQHNPSKSVLVGDINQLPATVISPAATKANFDWSMMDRLAKKGWPSVMLDTQYRMHPDICCWPSAAFYEDRLQTPEALQTRTLAAASHTSLLQRPRAFYQIKSQEKSKATSFHNMAEAKVIAKIVEHILKADAASKQSATTAAEGAMPLKTIGIISFYAAQVEAISKCVNNGRPLKNVRISTVDSFQGSECDVIILSCVRNNKHGNIGFLKDYRRLNVAVTRPKHCLMVVSNATNLCRSDSHLSVMINDMRSHGQVFSENSLNNILDPKPPKPKKSAKKSKVKKAAKNKTAQSSGKAKSKKKQAKLQNATASKPSAVPMRQSRKKTPKNKAKANPKQAKRQTANANSAHGSNVRLQARKKQPVQQQRKQKQTRKASQLAPR